MLRSTMPALEYDPVTENNLYMVVGEIRSDVKKLLNGEYDTNKRLTSLERWRWWQAGAGACLAFVAAKISLMGGLH
jgi:type II secretory pathway component PulL